jgi:hypothetical protein
MLPGCVLTGTTTLLMAPMLMSAVAPALASTTAWEAVTATILMSAVAALIGTADLIAGAATATSTTTATLTLLVVAPFIGAGSGTPIVEAFRVAPRCAVGGAAVTGSTKVVAAERFATGTTLVPGAVGAHAGDWPRQVIAGFVHRPGRSRRGTFGGGLEIDPEIIEVVGAASFGRTRPLRSAGLRPGFAVAVRPIGVSGGSAFDLDIVLCRASRPRPAFGSVGAARGATTTGTWCRGGFVTGRCRRGAGAGAARGWGVKVHLGFGGALFEFIPGRRRFFDGVFHRKFHGVAGRAMLQVGAVLRRGVGGRGTAAGTRSPFRSARTFFCHARFQSLIQVNVKAEGTGCANRCRTRSPGRQMDVS